MSKMILSLDGGGIRGAASAQFLHRVETVLHKDYDLSIRDCVDFYAGTSTGSIIALGLATTTLSVADINRLYNVTNARKIFAENRGLFEWDGINAPRYEASGKASVLANNFGDSRLADTIEDAHVLAVTYDIEHRMPTVLKSTKPEHASLLSCDIADASSAAPTFFPTAALAMPPDSDERWLIDGGVIANNPAMCAIAETRRQWPQTTVEDIRVLSVGTGYRTRKINGPESRDWGAMQWVTRGKLIEVLSDERVVDYQARTLLSDGNYIRVNAELRQQLGLRDAPDDAMDDISKTNIRKLKRFGDFLFEKYGDAAISMLLNEYDGPTLRHVDPHTGQITRNQ